MDEFLGEPAAFWIRVRAALRKAHIDSPEGLEQALGVCRPTYGIREDGGMWKIVEFRPTIQTEAIVGMAYTEDRANEIKSALEGRAA